MFSLLLVLMEKININEPIGYLSLSPTCHTHSTTVILPPYFQGIGEIESNLEIVYKPMHRAGYISELRIWKYMKNVQDDKAVPRMTKLNPVTTCYVQNHACWSDLNILGLMGSSAED